MVGVHFIPFAWAFGERMFLLLGVFLAVLGGVGLVAGRSGVSHAAEALAVTSGVVMLAIIAAYARGTFASEAADRRSDGNGTHDGNSHGRQIRRHLQQSPCGVGDVGETQCR